MNNLFRISKRNRKGVLTLFVISILIVFTPRILISLDEEEKFTLSSLPISKLENQFNQSKYIQNKYSNSFKRKKFKSPKSKFDPNQFKVEDWMNLGLSIKQANVIVKFTSRGIYSNDELKKIFVISDEFYQLIKDSTIYPKKENNFSLQLNDNKIESQPIKKVEINSANEEELVRIKGIGSFFAKQIIKKRDELGGFIEKSQLLEVWKMDQEKFDLIKDEFTIDNENIKKISINAATVEELKNHPYIRWNIANSIVKLRLQKNGFTSIEELKESHLITDEKFLKIKSYITL
jgi:DNA uptake protein ComE-like DNA-binding protein